MNFRRMKRKLWVWWHSPMLDHRERLRRLRQREIDLRERKKKLQSIAPDII
jgi:hypothetical protein